MSQQCKSKRENGDRFPIQYIQSLLTLAIDPHVIDSVGKCVDTGFNKEFLASAGKSDCSGQYLHISWKYLVSVSTCCQLFADMPACNASVRPAT